MSSGGPPSPAPIANNSCKGKGKGKRKRKRKEKGKNNYSNSSGNNSRASNTPMWHSFYNPWTGTISMWPRMCPPQ
jgi:hypothetical protein